MPTYLVLFIIQFAPILMQPLPKEVHWQIAGVVFLVTFLIPLVSIGTLKLSKLISDFQLIDKKQRILPFLFVTGFYGLTTYMFFTRLNIYNILFLVFATTSIFLLALTIITYFWKISIHGAAIGGVIGYIVAIGRSVPISSFPILFALAVLLAGMIISSRIALNAHKPVQVYAGFLFGFMTSFGALFIYL